MFYHRGGNPADQILTDSSDFPLSSLRLPTTARCFCFVFHAQFLYQSHLISPAKQAVLTSCTRAGMPNEGTNLLAHQPVLYLTAQCFVSNFILLCATAFLCHQLLQLSACYLHVEGQEPLLSFRE